MALLASATAMPRAMAAHSPTLDVFGSYFPAWLLCIVAGVFGAVLFRLIVVAWKLEEHLFPGVIIYPCVVAAVSMAVWLIFFRN